MAEKPAPKKTEQTAPTKPKQKPFAKKPDGDVQVVEDPLTRLISREAEEIDVNSIPASRTLSTINTVIDSFVNGGDLNGIKPEMERLLSMPHEKAIVVSSLLQSLDLDRLKVFLFIRERTEKLLERATRRGDLTCGDMITLNRIAAGEIAGIRHNLRRDGDEPTSTDSTSLVEKVDYRKQQVERRIERTVTGTSPQGREIIRRRIYALQKQMAGKPA